MDILTTVGALTLSIGLITLYVSQLNSKRVPVKIKSKYRKDYK